MAHDDPCDHSVDLWVAMAEDGGSGRNFEGAGGEGQILHGPRCDSRPKCSLECLSLSAGFNTHKSQKAGAWRLL